MNSGSSSRENSTPDTLGHYKILTSVGKGGLGEVFKAQDMRTGEIVALKKLHAKYQNNDKLLGLFHKEIMIHSRMVHKNCVRFISADLTPPQAHIVTAFINGTNCYLLTKTAGPVPPMVACCIMMDLLQGLEHLHCMDVVHSDLTPSNILIETTGRVLLADFGLSCDEGIEDYAGMIVGTPGYQAPERLQFEPITALSDIYCAGIVFYELLRGQRLFIENSPKLLMTQMNRLDFKWIKTPHSQLNVLLKQILNTALAVKPEKRFSSPREFMHDIYECLKLADIRYTRRAILQWMIQKGLQQSSPLPTPLQDIGYGAFEIHTQVG